jgi:CheY-like chemotaxis protein
MAMARVLVVDDELPVRQLLTTFLNHLGHASESACNGPEALLKIEDAHFDLVFTDYNMPGMNGHQLAEEIKRRKPGIPVVLITGGEPQGPSQHIDRMLLKPFSIAKLRETIASFL